MSNSVVVYGISRSSYVWSTRMALVEKGVEYTHIECAPRSSEQTERHPWGKVPAFEHGDVKLFETSAIIRYVDRAFEGPRLYPEDLGQAALVDQWMSALTYLYQSGIIGVVLPLLAHGAKPDDEAVVKASAEMRKDLERFNTAIGKRGYLVGNALTLADILLAPVVGYIGKLPNKNEVFKGLENFPAWQKNVLTRPSFAKTAPQLGLDGPYCTMGNRSHEWIPLCVYDYMGSSR
jgi:glutathione S-transferase